MGGPRAMSPRDPGSSPRRASTPKQDQPDLTADVVAALMAEALEPLHESMRSLRAALEASGLNTEAEPPKASGLNTEAQPPKVSGLNTEAPAQAERHADPAAEAYPHSTERESGQCSRENTPVRGQGRGVAAPQHSRSEMDRIERSEERMGTMAAATADTKVSFFGKLAENQRIVSGLRGGQHPSMMAGLTMEERSQLMGQRMTALLTWWEQLEEPTRTGWLARLVSSSHFGSFCLVVILLNTVSVAYVADWELQNPDQERPTVFAVLEWSFLSFFTLELILRLIVHRCYFFLNDEMKWNLFDFVLVMVSLGDTASGVILDSGTDGNVAFTRATRLIRLAKIMRIFRVLKVFRALSTILDSFANCAIPLFWTLVMLVFILFLFALFFMQGVSVYMASGLDSDALDMYRLAFGSLPRTGLTLFYSVSGGDWMKCYHLLEPLGNEYAGTFLVFMFLFVVAIFNVLTAIFVERAVQAAQPDRDEQVIEKRRDIIKDMIEFKRICSIMDIDSTGTLSLQELKHSMKNPTMVAYLASVGIAVHDVELFFHVVAGSSRATEVDLDLFVEGCMTMKGQATSLEVQQAIFITHTLSKQVKQLEKRIVDVCQRTLGGEPADPDAPYGGRTSVSQ